MQCGAWGEVSIRDFWITNCGWIHLRYDDEHPIPLCKLGNFILPDTTKITYALLDQESIDNEAADRILKLSNEEEMEMYNNLPWHKGIIVNVNPSLDSSVEVEGGEDGGSLSEFDI